MYGNELFTKAESAYRVSRIREGLADRRRRHAEARKHQWQGPLRGSDEMR